MTKVYWRHVFWMLTCLGLFASASIIAIVFWMTAKIDRLEAQKGSDLVSFFVQEEIENLRMNTLDYAHWSFAYEIVTARDETAVYDHMGTTALETDIFDQLFFLESSKELIYTFDDRALNDRASWFDRDAFDPLLDVLLAQDQSDYDFVEGVVFADDEYTFVVATRIIPDYYARLSPSDLPIMIGTIRMDEDWFWGVQARTQLDVQDVKPTPAQSFDMALALPGIGNSVSGYLLWHAPKSGTALRNEIMIEIGFICLAIFLVCGSAARYFHTQNRNLTRATRIASTDQLTGLLNRAGLENVLKSENVLRRMDDGSAAVIYLDLNDFKKLNDKHGHREGDIALKVTAQRLQASVRKSDFVARLGGDEFICLIIDESPEDAARIVSDRLLDLAQAPIQFSDHDEIVRCSIGIAAAKPGIQWDTLVAQADAAMYWSKKKRIEDATFFCTSMDESIRLA